jgi:hypothetical protein
MIVFAAARGPNPQHVLLKSIPWFLGLVVALGLLGWFILKLREWFNEDDGGAVSPEMMLTHFREMQGEGDLSDEEFRNIKRNLIGKPNSFANGAPSNSEQPAKPAPTESSES